MSRVLDRIRALHLDLITASARPDRGDSPASGGDPHADRTVLFVVVEGCCSLLDPFFRRFRFPPPGGEGSIGGANGVGGSSLTRDRNPSPGATRRPLPTGEVNSARG